MRRTISRLITGLRWRLLLLVLLACAPLVGLILNTASEERRRLVKDWKRRSEEMTRLATREEEQVIGQARQVLLALAQSAPVRSGNKRESKKWLDDLFNSNPRYANLGMVGTNGIVLASARPIPESENLSNRGFFSRAVATRAFAVGDFPDPHSPGKPIVNFGYPVLNSAGQVQAVVFAALDLDWVSRFESVLPAQLPPGSTWSEIDRTGKILVRYPKPEKWIGQPFPETELLKTVFGKQQGVVEAPSPEGIPSYHAFVAMHSQLVPDDVVTILGSISSDLLFADANRRMAGSLKGLAIAAGFAFLVGWFGSYILVLRPVRTLVKFSAKLGTGAFNTRTGLSHRGDELGQLTRTFDQMAQALEERELDRQAADKALKVSESRYRRLFETAQDGILILDGETGAIEDVNPFLIDMLACTREQLLGKKLWEAPPFKEIKPSEAEFRELQGKECVHYDDLPLKTCAGRTIHVEFVSNVFQSDGGKVIQCNVRDITERKQAEAQHKEYSTKLQVLSRRLVEAQERERRNIARELHDEIGQALTVMQLNLQAMLQSPNVDGFTPRLNQNLALVDRVLEQVRDISLNLRPSMLDDLGLEPALVWLTHRQAELAGFKGEVHADTLPHRLDPMIETVCFRIVQEALTNVMRHAHANSVKVELRKQGDQLHLRIHDDGVGFNVNAVRAKAARGSSLGLLSMEERAALAGGGLELSSIPKRGSEVHAWFPLKWQTQPVEAESP